MTLRTKCFLKLDSLGYKTSYLTSWKQVRWLKTIAPRVNKLSLAHIVQQPIARAWLAVLKNSIYKIDRAVALKLKQ